MRNVLRNVSTLTALACERLKRGSLGDPTHPGLRIMARPSGAKVWIYRFRDPAGKMAQLLIGSFPALSLADARSEWRNHRATRDKHGDPRDEVRRRQEAAKVAAIRGKGYTLTRAAESYQKEHLSKLARSVRNGRNPRTGASVLIRAARVPRFHASKTGNAGGKFSAGERLKAAVN